MNVHNRIKAKLSSSDLINTAELYLITKATRLVSGPSSSFSKWVTVCGSSSIAPVAWGPPWAAMSFPTRQKALSYLSRAWLDTADQLFIARTPLVNLFQPIIFTKNARLLSISVMAISHFFSSLRKKKIYIRRIAFKTRGSHAHFRSRSQQRELNMFPLVCWEEAADDAEGNHRVPGPAPRHVFPLFFLLNISKRYHHFSYQHDSS